jgi:uncharacterized protein YkwD
MSPRSTTAKKAAKKATAKKSASKASSAKASTKSSRAKAGAKAAAAPATKTKAKAKPKTSSEKAPAAKSSKRSGKAPPPPKFDIPAYSGSEVGAEELEFIEALNAYREQHGRLFPKQSEILHVLKHLGYRKVADA